jgi:hypothetical protein
MLVASVSSAGAALVSGTDGEDSVTVDTATGIEWLDASNTLGTVVSTALSEFPDYHLATQSQVETLLVDAGFPAVDLPDGSTTDSTSGNLLATTLGYSYNTWIQYYGSAAATWEYQSQADYLDSAGTGVDELVMDVRNPPLGSDGTYVDFYALGNSFGSGDSLNFVLLVKATPEPSTEALLSLGAIALGLRWKLRRRTE